MMSQRQRDGARALRIMRERRGDDHLAQTQRMARERVRSRLERRRAGIEGPGVSLPAVVLVKLFEDADRAEALAREVAWYRARIERGAWYPNGEPLPTDGPDHRPPPPKQLPIVEL